MSTIFNRRRSLLRGGFLYANRRVPARQPASFSLNRKENEAKETLPLRGACRLLTFGAVKGGDAEDGCAAFGNERLVAYGFGHLGFEWFASWHRIMWNDLLMPRPPEYQWFWGPHKNRAPLFVPGSTALINASTVS